MVKFMDPCEVTIASLAAQYDRLLTTKLEQDSMITDLRKELSYKDGVINSLKTENQKLKTK